MSETYEQKMVRLDEECHKRLKLERELEQVNQKLEHNTYWYKEEVQRDCRRQTQLKKELQLLEG